MKTVSIGLTIVGMLISWSCAVTDIESTVNLAQYKTFGWGRSSLNVTNPAYKGDLIDANIKASIQREFASRGVAYSSKKPDLLVSYEGYTETKQQGYSGAMYYYPFYSYRFFPFGGYLGGPLFWGGPANYYTYTQGTLVIDLRDRTTGKLIWRGLVQGSVDNTKLLKKSIAKGVKAIMKKYPVAPPSLIPIPKGRIS